MIRFARGFSLISALILPCLFAADFWEKKDFGEWNGKLVAEAALDSCHDVLVLNEVTVAGGLSTLLHCLCEPTLMFQVDADRFTD